MSPATAPSTARALPVTPTILTELDAEASTAVFRAVLGALSRPGRLTHLPSVPGRSPQMLPVLALADLMVSVCLLDSAGEVASSRTEELSRATGAPIAAPSEARIVLVGTDGPVGDEAAASAVRVAHRSTAGEPHRGALLVMSVDSLATPVDPTAPGSPTAPEATAAPSEVPVPAAAGEVGASAPEVPAAWSLSGPGVDGTAHVRVTGAGDLFRRSRADAVAGFPAGVDVLLVDRAGRLLGLPRTTAVTKEASWATQE